MLLSKGFEIELYTGSPQGDIVGLSDRIVHDNDGFVREPDNRNVEYTTAPFSSYDRLLCALVRPRQHLRQYLKTLGNYTLIPGSTLSLGDSGQFFRSDPENPYHTYIEDTYHTNIVTASVHINIGIDDPELLLRACRLVRLEAPLYLALSASSPFLDNQVTGHHSKRWAMFPKTPQDVPLFVNHNHFIQWTEEQLLQGRMQNVRHLWSSVRPNGPRRPYHLDRLELRICDLVTEPIQLLAITALLEARLTQFLKEPSLDPLFSSTFSPQDLITITNNNEEAVSRFSLEAQLTHWQTGKTLSARDWIHDIYQTVWPLAKSQGYSCFLSPIQKILREGNTAQKWLQWHKTGLTPRQIITWAIEDMESQESVLEDQLCPPVMA